MQFFAIHAVASSWLLLLLLDGCCLTVEATAGEAREFEYDRQSNLTLASAAAAKQSPKSFLPSLQPFLLPGYA